MVLHVFLITHRFVLQGCTHFISNEIRSRFEQGCICDERARDLRSTEKDIVQSGESRPSFERINIVAIDHLLKDMLNL